MNRSEYSRLSCSRPFLPMVRIFTVLPWPCNSRIRVRASRTMEELKPPQRPRSEVATISRWVWSDPVPFNRRGAASDPDAALARFARTASIRSA